MKPEQLRNAYKEFFRKSEAGQYFLAELTRLHEHFHAEAEKDPESAVANTQRAAGIRSVLNHIRDIVTEVKKK